MAVFTCSGCAGAPGLSMRLAGRDEGQDTLSSCESALKSATENDADSAPGLPLMLRRYAAQHAQDEWLDVAEYCSGRFAEGSLSSALAAYRYYQLSQQREDSTAPHSALAQDGLNESELSSLGFDSSTITETQSSAIALAEDRSAFALEILAAKNDNDSTLLALSDNQKAVAQTFVSVNPKADDPREKVYSITNLLTHTQTIDDASTGLLAPTASAVLMNCARAEIAALTAKTAQDESSGDASSDDGSASDADTESGTTTATTSDAASDTDSTTTDTASATQQMTRLVAELVVLRAYQAFKLGYPAFEAAIFAPTK
ncbi:MAG: hypothetical protein ABF780_06420 [Bifidobacterium aquikefiri]|nr:hypothetical protein [Bifidobacterium aquikefiri]